VNSILQAPASALGRLSPREQRLLGLFALLAVLSGLYVFVIQPAFVGRARMEQHITSMEHDLATMQALAMRIRRLESGLGKAAANVDAAKDFSLFSFIDRAAAAAMSRDSIASMNPSRHALRDGTEETLVELRVNGVSLPELVSLLQRIEAAEQPVYIKRLEIKRRYDDKSRFDATVVTAAVSRT
jgi:type II secretory pathway component PulM